MSLNSKRKIVNQSSVFLIAIMLGIVSVFIDMTIGIFAYKHTIKSTEEHYHTLYMNKARILARIAYLHKDDSDDAVLRAIATTWVSSGDKPPDEYICVTDNNADLVLHTAYPDTIGNNVGDNTTFDRQKQQVYSFREIVESQTDFVGDYISSRGQEQIAAFAAIPQRRWTLGVHRSKETLIEEIKSNVFPFILGFVVVCGFLLPVSLVLLYGTFRASDRKRIRAEEELDKHYKHLEELIESRTIELNKVNIQLQTDIIERKRVEGKLRKSEKYLQNVFDSIQDGISVLDKNLNIVQVNRTMGKWYSHSLPLLGKKCYQAYRGNSRPCAVCPAIRTLEEGTPQMEEVPLVNSEGTKGWLELYTFPLNGNGAGVIAYVRNVTDRKRAEEQVKASLEEKEVLLKEIHHRVKNNMQVVSSLLKLQARNVKDKDTIDILEESQNRIKAMSMIHEKLYRSENLANINFGAYIKELTNSLFRSYRMSVARVALKMEVDDITIDIDSVVPCGLIVNELITNSLKYAFPDNKKGEIKISLRKIADCGLQNAELKTEISNQKSEMIELIFSDNGIGIPEDLDYRNTDSMGLRLIFKMTEHQLGGKVELHRSNGTEFRISFKEEKYNERI